MSSLSGLIAASVNSVVYFGFYRHPKAMAVYGSLNLMVGVSTGCQKSFLECS